LVGPGDGRPTPTGEVIVNFLNRNYPCVFEAYMYLASIHGAAKAHVSALTLGKNGERYIYAEPVPYTLNQLFKILENISGIKKPKLVIPINLLMLFSMCNELIVAIFGLGRKGCRPLISFEVVRYLSLQCDYVSEKSKRDLGCVYSGIENEIRESVDWYIRNGYVKKSSRVRYYKKIGKLK